MRLCIGLLVVRAAYEFSDFTRELLLLPEDAEASCTVPQPAELNDLATDLAAAEHQWQLEKRLSKYFAGVDAGERHLDDPQTLVDRLAHAVNVVQQVCQLANGETHGNGPLDADKAHAVKFIMDNLFDQFDKEGYNSMVKAVIGDEHLVRFQETLSELSTSLPHCDLGSGGGAGSVSSGGGSSVKWPGGPFRLNFGFNLSKMISEMVLKQANSASSNLNSPGSQMVSMMAVMSVVSIVETVVAIVIDIVPPMIPPPFWILWSLPCVPMLTGANCLFSVLYPVSLSDFMLASTTDQQMDGELLAFPAKYRQKVGITSDSAYQTCAMAYFGMYCAHLFPMCWIPIGIRSAMSFPMCFVHCLLTLLACPGFWIDDIIGPCMNVSVPPLCSFSLFVNFNRIPPQFVSFDDSHPYPRDCPEIDPRIDFNDTEVTTTTPRSTIYTEPFQSWSTEGEVIGKLDDYFNVIEPKHFECDCDGQCKVGDSPEAAEYCRACNCPTLKLSIEEVRGKVLKRDVQSHQPPPPPPPLVIPQM